MRKAITGSVFLVTGGAIALIIGIWIISLVNTSVVLPTSAYLITNQTINFATNNTYTQFGTIASCINDTPAVATCGVQVADVISVMNSTTVINTGAYAWTTTEIKLTSYKNTQNITMGDYLVTYNYYDYAVPQAETAITTVQTTVFNSFTLLAVGLIVLAAAVIITYFGFGRRSS